MANEENKSTAPAKATKTAVKKEDKPKAGFFKSIAKWFREMKSELKKVVWPTPHQVVNNTVVALVVMAASAVVIWGFDWIAGQIVGAVLMLAGKG